MLDTPITINRLTLKNRLVLPPMHTGLATDDGRATPAQAEYYAARARFSAPGLIIMEHTCITEAGRARLDEFTREWSEIMAIYTFVTGKERKNP